MSDDFDQMYREVILDHYKNPRGHGVLEPHDAHAEGQNPLCGDEVSIFVRFGDDGETIDEIGFEGRGCAISQAATSMLTELVKGRKAADVATLPKEELLEEIGIPLTPIRLKCAILGLGVLKVALHRSKGTPLPRRVAEPCRRPPDRRLGMPKIHVAPLDEFPPGSSKIVTLGWTSIGVYNCAGKLYALEDRCSHDDGPLCEGEWDEDLCRVICPRHGSAFDLRPASRCHSRPSSGGDVSGHRRGRRRAGRSRRMSDGLIRCWETDDVPYQRYHDEEWGRPIRDERGLYERFCLEGFQSGLSWLTILRKREGFRAAFEGFVPDRVAEFGERRRRAAPPGRVDRASPRQDRGDDRERAGDRRPPRDDAPAGARLGTRARRARLQRLARFDARVGRPLEGAPQGRLSLRWPDHGLGRHAGLRDRQRPPA